MRGRGGNQGGGNRKGPNPLSRSYESTGPDVKIRGTALHIAEKYVSLARDAQSSGDPVLAENYLQHAEHYYRVIAAAQAQMQQPIQIVRSDIQNDDEDEDDFDTADPRAAAAAMQGETPQPYSDEQPSLDAAYGERIMGDRPERMERGDRRPMNGNGRHFRDRGDRMDGRNQGERGQGERGQGDRAQGDRNGDQPREPRAPRGDRPDYRERREMRGPRGEFGGEGRGEYRERPERAERPDRAERPERTERPERAERMERPERAEREYREPRGERAAPVADEAPISSHADQLPAFLTGTRTSRAAAAAAAAQAEPAPAPIEAEAAPATEDEAVPRRRTRGARGRGRRPEYQPGEGLAEAAAAPVGSDE